MGKKHKPGEWTLGAIKWFDFLGTYSFAFFGCILCGIIMINPFMLMTPPIALAIGFGMIVTPVVFKSLSSMIILAGLHDTWGLFTSTVFIYFCFLVAFIVTVKTKLFSIINPSSLSKVKDCALSIGMDSVGDKLNQAVGDKLAEATASVNAVTDAAANASQAAVAAANPANAIPTTINPSTGAVAP